MASQNTTIQISIETRDRLMAIGKKGESYDDLIEKLLDDRERYLAATLN